MATITNNGTTLTQFANLIHAAVVVHNEAVQTGSDELAACAITLARRVREIAAGMSQDEFEAMDDAGQTEWSEWACEFEETCGW